MTITCLIYANFNFVKYATAAQEHPFTVYYKKCSEYNNQEKQILEIYDNC